MGVHLLDTAVGCVCVSDTAADYSIEGNRVSKWKVICAGRKSYPEI